MRSESAITFAKNLKKLRVAHGFSLRKVGRELGIAHGNIHRYEMLSDDWMMPGIDVIDKLAEFYGVRVADLFVKDGVSYRNMQFAQGTIEDAINILNNRLLNTGIQIRRTPILADKLLTSEVI